MKTGIARILISLACLLMMPVPASQAASNEAEGKLIAKAKIIHQRALTLDTHVDIPSESYDPGEKSTAGVKPQEKTLSGPDTAPEVGAERTRSIFIISTAGYYRQSLTSIIEALMRPVEEDNGGNVT